MGGQPVKVTWTRDDDLHNDFFHTVSVDTSDASGTLHIDLDRATAVGYHALGPFRPGFKAVMALTPAREMRSPELTRFRRAGQLLGRILSSNSRPSF